MDDSDASQSFYSDDDQPLTDNKLLYSGAPAGLTKYIAYQLMFQFAVKHSLTTKALEELLHLLAVFLPSDAALPKSVRQLKMFFVKKHLDASPVMQKYCPTCHVTMNEVDKLCSRCQTAYSEFVTMPVGPQLRARLESKLLCIDKCMIHQ